MANTTVLVKFPGQPLCYMEVPTDQINAIHRSVSGLQTADVEIASLYHGFYYILMDRDRRRKRLPYNMTAAFINPPDRADLLEVAGPFVICKLPKGLTGRLGNITPEDAAQLQKLLHA